MGKRRFHWDPIDDCVMMETDENAETIVTYTHEPGQFGPLLSENRGGTESYHHYDALGSTTMLTDDTGAVTDTFQYDAWGNQVDRTGATPTPYQWIGRWGYESNAPTEDFYVRARVYKPTAARWTSYDPLWPKADASAYAYAMAAPTVHIDPSGHKCVFCTSHIYLRVEIDPLDADLLSPGFRSRAELDRESVNIEINPYRLMYPRLATTGLKFNARNVAPDASLDFFFFVSFDICETPYPPGVCQLWVSEVGTQTKFIEPDGTVRLISGHDEGNITGINTSKVEKRASSVSGGCNYVLIFSDAPGAVFKLRTEEMAKTLRQHFELRDSATGDVVKQLNNSIDFSVGSGVNPIFTPPPDDSFTSR